MPPHKLNLKDGCTVMLLMNLNSKRGLCNVVLNIYNSVLHCKILTGSHSEQEVLIPKLKLAPSDANFPFTLQRTQFPIRLSYSMTISFKDRHLIMLEYFYVNQYFRMGNYTLHFQEQGP